MLSFQYPQEKHIFSVILLSNQFSRISLPLQAYQTSQLIKINESYSVLLIYSNFSS